MKNPEGLKARAKALRLHGLLAHWTEAVAEPAPASGWIEPLLDWEEQERARRSLERRLQDAHIGRFKSVCDFDWTWSKRCDRATTSSPASCSATLLHWTAIPLSAAGYGTTPRRHSC